METAVQSIWTKSKLLVKSGIIAFIILLLQIPIAQVKNLIEERELRQQEALTEVSSKWAGRQNIMGPVLALPYWQTVGENGPVKNRVKATAYFLPDDLAIEATATPQEKHRGIFKVMLYMAGINMSGSFKTIQPQKLGIAPEDVIWSEAYLRLGASDNRGLNEEVQLKVNDTTLVVSPFVTPEGKDGGLQAPLPLASAEAAARLNFSTAFSINGAEQLQFTPTGKNTRVQLSSAWPHPSFTGSSLPQASNINKDGFTASWKSLGHKQTFPQQWKGSAYSLSTQGAGALSSAAFGVDLYLPVSGYQKTMRSIKYSLLCLVLTFAAFFLIETTAKKSAHPFQYGLIGLALILFYTLLLSFSEYIGFNPAYGVASLFTIALIGWFAHGILASGRMAVVMTALLVLLYGYVFTILQLQDYSLLLGSLGLFLTLAVVMHFSKKIQW